MSVPAGVLTLDANATLKDKYGRDAVLTHGAFGPFAGSLVNTPPPPPRITRIEVSTPLPDAGFYSSALATTPGDVQRPVTGERASGAVRCAWARRRGRLFFGRRADVRVDLSRHIDSDG